MSCIITEPMLAPHEIAGTKRPIVFPQAATPKIDGRRVVRHDATALGRKWKPLPNVYARDLITAWLPVGADGEGVGGEANETNPGLAFHLSMSALGREDGQPEFTFCWFDWVGTDLSEPYLSRMKRVEKFVLPKALPFHVWKVLPVIVKSQAELDEFEAKCVGLGFEGVMIRDPNGPYKCGRATPLEGYLQKVKRFEDSEAEILGTHESMTNQNAAEQDAFGRTKRSTAKAGKVGVGELGGFSCRDLHTGVEFDMGATKAYEKLAGAGLGVSGAELWANREKLVGRVVKYRFQPAGVKEKPRFPQLLGFRDDADMPKVKAKKAAPSRPQERDMFA